MYDYQLVIVIRYHVRAAIFAFGSYVALADRSFDITDEAFYVLSIRFSDLLRAQVTQFGRLVSPLVGDLSIYGLRIVALFLNAAAFVALGLAIWRFLENDDWWSGVTFVGAGLLASLHISNYWLLTISSSGWQT